jgi:hypothetical protein
MRSPSKKEPSAAERKAWATKAAAARAEKAAARAAGEISDEVVAVDHNRNTWSPAMAAAWSGIPTRTLYRMLRDGNVPCIPIGDSQTQKWPFAHDGKRRRACFRFMIPRVAFMRWYENIGKPADPDNTADGKVA